MNLTSIENLLNSVDDFFYTYLLTALLILAGERTHLDEAGGTADDGVPAATPASSQPAASTGADA